jgi:hypothetical protein
MWASMSPAAAQDLPNSIQTAAACAPRAATGELPRDILRLIGAQGSVPRYLYGDRDLVIVDGGTSRNVRLDQQFVVRRQASGYYQQERRGVITAGRIRIVAVNETTAVARVEAICDGLLAGDYLEPYVAEPLPAGVNSTAPTGEPDFSAPGRILFGDNERTVGGAGDFMVTDVGKTEGAAPGLRFAIYRDLQSPGLPLSPVGEAIVVFATSDTSVVRLTLTRDAVYSGDLLVLRRQ